MQDAAEGREVVLLVFDFMDRRGVWQTRPDAYTSAIRRLQQVCMVNLACATGCTLFAAVFALQRVTVKKHFADSLYKSCWLL